MWLRLAVVATLEAVRGALIIALLAFPRLLWAADPATPSGADAPRVKAARAKKGAGIQSLFSAEKLSYPPRALLLRVLKDEGQLELWVEPSASKPYQKLKSYPICAKSGGPGPKRKEGDGQVPEGFYAISGFNPSSNFLLSLRVSYPNDADRIRNRGARLGGDIFIHGNCVTIGCVPIEDDGIEELYVIAQDAQRAGAAIQVHSFPARMDRADALKSWAAGDAALTAFWDNLAEGYRWFEQKKQPPRIGISSDGRYTFR
jgi:murein L,D-transpeptidase YafK